MWVCDCALDFNDNVTITLTKAYWNEPLPNPLQVVIRGEAAFNSQLARHLHLLAKTPWGVLLWITHVKLLNVFVIKTCLVNNLATRVTRKAIWSAVRGVSMLLLFKIVPKKTMEQTQAQLHSTRFFSAWIKFSLLGRFISRSFCSKGLWLRQFEVIPWRCFVGWWANGWTYLAWLVSDYKEGYWKYSPTYPWLSSIKFDRRVT